MGCQMGCCILVKTLDTDWRMEGRRTVNGSGQVNIYGSRVGLYGLSVTECEGAECTNFRHACIRYLREVVGREGVVGGETSYHDVDGPILGHGQVEQRDLVIPYCDVAF